VRRSLKYSILKEFLNTKDFQTAAVDCIHLHHHSDNFNLLPIPHSVDLVAEAESYQSKGGNDFKWVRHSEELIFEGTSTSTC
jgi:hypothetical protein